MIKKYNFGLTIEGLPYILIVIKQKIDEDNELNKFETDLICFKEKTFNCSVCNKEISRKKFEYSIDIYGKALCMDHQNEAKATLHAKKLFNSLIKQELPCKLEKGDGHKTVDISISIAKMYIEIDGKHHITNPKQFITDLKRDQYSHKNGYVTKRIPNHMIKDHLNEITNSIVIAAKERIKEVNGE